MLTGTLTKDQVAAVIKLALDKDGKRKPDFTWERCLEVTQVGESRAWLIVRRRELELTAPSLLIDFDAIEADAKAALKAQDRLSEYNVLDYLSPLVKDMYLEQKLSWGEIMVRLDRPEGLVRKAFRHNSSVKDRGLRTGKGGRFAYGAGELYSEHRRGEGIAIPVTLKGRPQSAEDLANGAKRLDHKKVLAGKRQSKGAAKRSRNRAPKPQVQPEPTMPELTQGTEQAPEA